MTKITPVCSFCGEMQNPTTDPDTVRKVARAHMLKCEQHPAHIMMKTLVKCRNDLHRGKSTNGVYNQIDQTIEAVMGEAAS